jgi:glycosyltransferase involved in cell wall biosynthesis
MRVLHLLSDWKWTGASDPVVSLCENLARTGLDVQLGFRKAPEGFPEKTVGKEVTKRRIKGHDVFRLSRYFSVRDWAFDLYSIGRYAVREGFDIVHTHLNHDHSIAAASLLTVLKRPLLVRTDHKRDGLDQGFAMKRLLSRTDGLTAYSRKILANDMEHFGYPEKRTCLLPPGIAIYGGPTQDLRAELGIHPEEKIIGVIGRLKPDRGYDEIIKAFKLLRDRIDGVKLVIVGRSSQIEESVKKPVAALGLQEDVVLAGYRFDDYFSMISTFDLFVMMRAGSDGTARALREVLAAGKPAIVSDRGMLPELVTDGKTGYVVTDEIQLARRMEEMLTQDGLRAALGEAARKAAVEEWDFGAQASRCIEFYERLLSLGRR